MFVFVPRRCLASNTVLSKERRSSLVTVTVLEGGEEVYRPPSFLSPKKHLKVRQGEDAVLECLATGVPLPNISWQRKCESISGCICSDSCFLEFLEGMVTARQSPLVLGNAFYPFHIPLKYSNMLSSHLVEDYFYIFTHIILYFLTLKLILHVPFSCE